MLDLLYTLTHTQQARNTEDFQFLCELSDGSASLAQNSSLLRELLAIIVLPGKPRTGRVSSFPNCLEAVKEEQLRHELRWSRGVEVKGDTL